MTSSTPVSPPAAVNTSSTANDDSKPLSPIHHTSSFPHQTSANVATRTPYIDTSVPAINAAPVELDGGEAVAVGDVVGGREGVKGQGVSPGLGEEEDIEQEFLGDGERGVGTQVREKRAAMLATRSKDPGVIVDVPNDPTAEEVEAAKIADGTTTPAVLPPSNVEGTGQ